ncbi:MAG TPA: alpha/beta hydrolase [Spirillospora sp.]
MPRLRTIMAAVLLAATVGSTSAAAGHAVEYAAPRAMPELSAATLDARFEAARREIARALATARRFHDEDRVRVLSSFLRGGRRFLAFDPRGDGKAVEVIGDLRRADRVAVVVPGADNELTTFDEEKFAGSDGRALYRQARAAAPGTRLAVVAWLGYDAPSLLSPGALRTDAARTGARALHRFVTGVHRVSPHARFALLCHSYGSVVCVKAARPLASLPVDDIALYGSPGTTADDVAAIGTPARVWAGRSKGDWVRLVPDVRVAGVGFGPDPVSPDFGAMRFDAGSGFHSGYFSPGSPSLRNLALIATGHSTKVTRA